MTRRYMLAAALVALPQTALAFESGQRWSCVTDQGAAAFLAVHGVDSDRIAYSWGRANPGSNQLMTLCDVRDRLELSEIQEFCQLLGDEPSPGHDALRAACRDKQ